MRCTTLGWGDGPEDDSAYAFFERGNIYTLGKLKDHFGTRRAPGFEAAPGEAGAGESPAQNAERAERLLRSLVGGEWIVDTTRPDGSVFRARTVYTLGPDGRSVIADSWLGDASGMHPHGHTVVSRDGAASPPGTLTHTTLDETGGLTRGGVRAGEGDTLEWDWRVVKPDGAAVVYDVRVALESADAIRFILHHHPAAPADAEPRKLVETVFRRVERAPETHLRLTPRPVDADDPTGDASSGG